MYTNHHYDEEDEFPSDALAQIDSTVYDHKNKLDDEQDEERGWNGVTHYQLGDIGLGILLLEMDKFKMIEILKLFQESGQFLWNNNL